MHILKKTIIVCLVFTLALILNPSSTLAHVTVKPSQVSIAARTNFTISVPTEEDTPTVKLRLLIPEGLEKVQPIVKPGWDIQLIKDSQVEDERITEIIWTEGRIPPGQKDEFVFSAQAPLQETSLNWKAYQTYASGNLIAWDQDPNQQQESVTSTSQPHPFSTTIVTNDLDDSLVQSSQALIQTSSPNNLPLFLSIIALLVAGASLWLHLLKSKTHKN